MLNTKLRMCLLVTASALCSVAIAQAPAATYPSKPITVIHPYPPGGVVV